MTAFWRPNALPSLDSLPPQPFVGGVLTPFSFPSWPGPARKQLGRQNPRGLDSLSDVAMHGVCYLEQVASLGLDGLIWKQGHVIPSQSCSERRRSMAKQTVLNRSFGCRPLGLTSQLFRPVTKGQWLSDPETSPHLSSPVFQAPTAMVSAYGG